MILDKKLHVDAALDASLAHYDELDHVQAAELNDKVERDGTLLDVEAVDKLHRFTFRDLEHREPFPTRQLGHGILVLNDRILTVEERNRRVEIANLRKAKGEPHEKEVGLQYARHTTEARLLEHGYSDHCAYVGALAVSELCGNVSIHGAGDDDRIAGFCNVFHFPAQEDEEGFAVILATNAAARPGKTALNRAKQTSGRGLSDLAGFVGKANIGRCRASIDDNGLVKSFHDSKLSDLAPLGNTTTFVRIPQNLEDASLAQSLVFDIDNIDAI